MNGINVNLWAMRSGLDDAVNQYNMGFITRAEFANMCFDAREPYMGVIKNTILYIRDRWFQPKLPLGDIRAVSINQIIRIMSTISLDCRGRRMMERYIADLQTIYSHVEFMSYNGKRLTVAVLA